MYSSVGTWLSKYPKLSATGVSSAGMYGWLDEASSEADSYLVAAGISTPVTPCPAVLAGKVEALAFCNFVERNLQEASRDAKIPEVKEKIIEWFKGLAEGTVVLVGAGGDEIGGDLTIAPWSNVDAYVPTFGAGPIEDAVVDPNRIDDEETRRG
jgi:phage gp36-like protein